jgi:hypothetical protein
MDYIAGSTFACTLPTSPLYKSTFFSSTDNFSVTTDRDSRIVFSASAIFSNRNHACGPGLYDDSVLTSPPSGLNRGNGFMVPTNSKHHLPHGILQSSEKNSGTPEYDTSVVSAGLRTRIKLTFTQFGAISLSQLMNVMVQLSEEHRAR